MFDILSYEHQFKYFQSEIVRYSANNEPSTKCLDMPKTCLVYANTVCLLEDVNFDVLLKFLSALKELQRKPQLIT